MIILPQYWGKMITHMGQDDHTYYAFYKVGFIIKNRSNLVQLQNT